MTEIKDVKVYDLKECIVASGYAMRTEPYDYNDEILDWDKIFESHLNRCKRLVQASKNSEVKCHDNFLTGIRVSFDIKYPQYLSPEMQRYHWFDIVTSMSKMHRLLKMDVDKSCNKYVSQSAIDTLKTDIERWNMLNDMDWTDIESWVFDLRNGETLVAKTKEEALYYAWMICVSDCPLGVELWMRVSTNYKQLQTIYNQRKHHKLKEDWGPVCKMIEELPYAKEFLL